MIELMVSSWSLSSPQESHSGWPSRFTGNPPLRTVSGPAATPTLSRSRDGPGGKEGPQHASRLQSAVEYSLFCPENVGYHGGTHPLGAIARVIPGARPGLQELVDVTSCSLI